MKRKSTMTAGGRLLALVLILGMLVPGYFVFAEGLAGADTGAVTTGAKTQDISAAEEDTADGAAGSAEGAALDAENTEAEAPLAEPEAAAADVIAEPEAAVAEDAAATPDDVVQSDAAPDENTPDPLEGCDFAISVTGSTQTDPANINKELAKAVSFDTQTGVLTITGNVTVAMKDGIASTTQRIVVAADSTITLNGVSIHAAEGPGIRINSDAAATIELQGSNTVKTDAYDYAGIEVAWQDSNTFADLIIKGSGELLAVGGISDPRNSSGAGGGAGIGGSYDANGVYGNITINSGTVTAKGGGRSAGIGSSDNPADGTSHGSYNPNKDTEWGIITINGGTVAAEGVGNGAGIGGGNHTSSGKIVINDGDVTATGDSGIGSGLGSSSPDKLDSENNPKGPGYYSADVTVNGGNVTAHATNNMGAGIGGGMYSDAYVTITGGTVNATVDQGGKEYQGGAGIGGGYQGCAVVTITGGDITATGGHGAPGIGNGAGAAVISPKQYQNGQWTGEKHIRTGAPTIAGSESAVNITGGTVHAYGGRFSAGIGSGNFTEWSNVNISGGTVYAEGYRSSEEEMLGGAGIGSGVTAVPSKKEYMVKTQTNVKITGGDVIAIGGWGASGIGSGSDGTRNEDGSLVRPGSEQQMANTVTIDAEKATIEAYADGTKFAIDTRDVTGDGGDGTTTTSHTEGRNITGSVLQGTFVHVYTSEDDVEQGTEGLSSIQVINDKTGDAKELTNMPEGYRSFATNVSEAGTYSVYSDAEEIAAGGGRYFNRCTDEKRSDEDVSTAKDIQERNVQYQAKDGEICDNFYLFPVKTILVTKDVQADESILDGIDQTLYFGLWNDDKDVQDYVRVNENGQISYDKDDAIWIQTIEVKDGVPQGTAAFAGIDEGTYAVSELDKNRIDNKEKDMRMQFGTPIEENSPVAIVKIETTHGEGDDNDATIDKNTWTDQVTVINHYEKIVASLKLQLSKALPQFYNAGEAANATTVFKVTVLGDAAEGEESQAPLYENYFSFIFDAAGEQSFAQPLEITNIDGAKTLVVEEVYSAGYDAAAADGEGAVKKIDLTDPDLDMTKPIEVSFTNTFNPEHPVFGSGIINKYHEKTYVNRGVPVPQAQ